IHTPEGDDDRLREILRELSVLAHDLAGTDQQVRPRRERVEQVGAEIGFLLEQIEAADAEISAAAERMTILERELAGRERERVVLGERLHAVEEGAAVARDRLTAIGGVEDVELPE